MSANSLNPSKKKNTPSFANFGEYLYWAYANLQMLVYALKCDKRQYDRTCYMLRAKAYKAYKEGRWEINDLYKNNRWKLMDSECCCWYCGKEVASKSELTADHIFPRSKGGDSSIDNLVMVCKSCNSSKGNMDLIEWFFEKQDMFPLPYIFAHYYKQIYLYAKAHNLLNKHRPELEAMELPFNLKYIIYDFPQPEFFDIYFEEDGKELNPENRV